MPNDTHDEQRPFRRAVAIAVWARWVAGFLGLAGLGSGGTAVFITRQEAGPVALIAAGVVFIFVALGGVMPTRLKVGDNEAEWVNEVGQAAAAVAVSAVTENKERLNENLTRLSELMPRDHVLAPSYAGGLVYMSYIYRLAKQAIDGRTDIEAYQYNVQNEIFLILKAINGTIALVEPVTEMQRVLTRDELSRKVVRVTNHLNSAKADYGIDRALLIAEEVPPRSFHAAIVENSPSVKISFAAIKLDDGSSQRRLWNLIRAIDRMLGLSAEPQSLLRPHTVTGTSTVYSSNKYALLFDTPDMNRH
jgi:hypothetical protein